MSLIPSLSVRFEQICHFNRVPSWAG